MSLRKWLELTVHTIFPIKLTIKYQNTISESVAYRGGVQTPPLKFRWPSKIVPNSTRLWKLLKIAEFRMTTPQDVRKKGSKNSKTTAGLQLFYISNDK
jgi:hypothetical protein